MAWKRLACDLLQSPYMLIMFFGSSAIRMLRETWEGRVNVQTDPASGQQTVEPKGADLLAQELFSMLNDNTPQVQNAPVTLNQSRGAGGLTINSSGDSSDPAVLHVAGGNVTLAGTGNVVIGTPSSGTSTGAAIVMTGTSISLPPLGVINLPATSWTPLSPQALPTIHLANSAGAIPGQAYMGMVVGGSGSTYTMSVAGLAGTITATVPEVASGYTVPANTWCVVVSTDDGAGGINYFFQPYPFASQTISGPTQALAGGGAVKNLLTGLQNLGILVDATTSSPPTISGTTQAVGAGGALANLLIGLNNLGIVANATSSTPQVPGGAVQSFAAPGGYHYNLAVALQNLGIISAASVNWTGGPTITGSRAGNPALANLLTGLAGLNHIVDGTTP